MRELARSPRLGPLLEVLAQDVRTAAAGYPLAKVTTVDGFRMFDPRQLSANDSRLELVGIFPRLDRAFARPDTCGELRFIYRLRYDTQPGGSPRGGTLPLSANVVFVIPKEDGSCTKPARAFALAEPAKPESWSGPTGPLSEAARERLELWSIETNLQALRLQSSVSPTLGGNVDYSLRVFRLRDGVFAPAPLENTPDLRALADPALEAELIAHLGKPETLHAIDQGTLVLPEKFLAKGVHSFAPRGMSRLANRLYSQVLSEDDFRGLDLARFSTIGSPKALLRRLDGLTCSGCHQSRSIAGFHFVGDDPPETPTHAALLSGASTHLTAELARRREHARAVASGEPASDARPPAEQQGHSGRFGAPCSLGDAGFAALTCEGGLACQPLEDRELGVCLDDDPIGAPCEFGSLPPKRDPRADYPSPIQRRSCGPSAQCYRNISGFAVGACYASCSGLGDSGACADFLDVDAFQNCLRLGQSHEDCQREHVLGLGLRACDDENPCRQDYVCVRTKEPQRGVCVTPYFVYPVRLDGRPALRADD